MTSALQFTKDTDSRPGVLYFPKPNLRRLVAPNAGPFTYTGTGSYILGRGEVAVIDPGPGLRPHLEKLLRALEGETVSHIIITHTHRDHSPLSRALRDETGAPIVGCPPLPAAPGGAADDMGEALDPDYAPDQVLADGEVISGPGWSLKAVATPGHVSNHYCYEWLEERDLFSGDHIMGWASSVILPPDGDMRAYIQSLKRVLAAKYKTLWPTHGLPVTDPQRYVAALLAHRQARETQILARLRAGDRTISQIVAALYQQTPKALRAAAGQSVLAHLLDLCARGRVDATPRPGLDASYKLQSRDGLFMESPE